MFAFCLAFLGSNREIRELTSKNLAQAERIKDLEFSRQPRWMILESREFMDSLKLGLPGEAVFLVESNSIEASLIVTMMMASLKSCGWRINATEYLSRQS